MSSPKLKSKIAHLTTVHSSLDVRIFHKECRSLAEAGYDVTLVAPAHQDADMSGVQIAAVPRYGRRLQRATRGAWQLYRRALAINADLYHFHDPELLPVGLLLRLRGKAVIYDVHEDVPADILDKHYIPAWLRKPLSFCFRRFENFSAARLSAVVTATPSIARGFTRVQARTAVVRNFPSMSEIQSAELPRVTESRTFVYTGGVTPLRGLREMVEAIGLLPAGCKATLAIAGPEWPSDYRSTLQNVQGWERVHDYATLRREQLPAVLADARAGLLLYHPIANHVEAEPNKLFEYMSAGIPVIASDFPMWREIITRTGCGLLVDPKDPRDIAGAMQHLLDNPAEAAAMGSLGRRAVEDHYNWQNEEKKLLDLYYAITPSSATVASTDRRLPMSA